MSLTRAPTHPTFQFLKIQNKYCYLQFSSRNEFNKGFKMCFKCKIASILLYINIGFARDKDRERKNKAENFSYLSFSYKPPLSPQAWKKGFFFFSGMTSSSSEMETTLQYSCLGNAMDRDASRLPSMGLQRVRHDFVGRFGLPLDINQKCSYPTSVRTGNSDQVLSPIYYSILLLTLMEYF